MNLNEKFEVEFKDKYSSQQKNLLLNAIKDLYLNLEDYEIVERNDTSKDQTLRFMDNNYISKNEISDLIEHYAFNLNVCEWGDILKDRDRKNNLLYILYIPNAKIGNWNCSKSKEKLLYIKWNPNNKKILSFHTMKKIHDTNRDELKEKRMRFVEDKFEIYNTHDKYKYINRWYNLYYDKISENLFVLYNGYIEIVDQMKFSEFKYIYDEYTLCKPTDKIVQIWKRDKKLEEKLSYEDITKKLFYTGNNNSHLKKFYDLKRQYNGKDVSNIKVITANVSNEGYCDILFSVKATKDDTKKKELVGNNGELVDNISNEYEVILRINDFWDLIDEFGLEKKNDFTKNDVVALIQLSQDIKLSDTTPSFWWMGTSYYLTQDDASLMPCNIVPKFWNRDDLRPNVKVSKSMEGVLKNLGFFTQQIAMSIKKNLKEQGYII